MTELERKTALNKVLMSYADTPSARELVIRNFITNEGSVIDYIIALSDGLRYGNWPWTQYSKPVEYKDIPKANFPTKDEFINKWKGNGGE